MQTSVTRKVNLQVIKKPESPSKKIVKKQLTTFYQKPLKLVSTPQLTSFQTNSI
jgi:hypothetical protein